MQLDEVDDFYNYHVEMEVHGDAMDVQAIQPQINQQPQQPQVPHMVLPKP